MNLDVSIKIVPVWDRLNGPFRFLGIPENIKRVKEKVFFEINDGAGKVPCQIGVEHASFTVNSLLLVEGLPVKFHDQVLLEVKKIDIAASEKLDFPLKSVSDLLKPGDSKTVNRKNKSPGIHKLSNEVFCLVGLYYTPRKEEAGNFNVFYLKDATGLIKVKGAFVPGINFSNKFDGLPIKVIGKLKDDSVWAMKVVTSLPNDKKAVKYRLLKDLFMERKIKYLKVR
ncbi:hypothetical protein ACFL35_16955 [Candidatus Riflebacteria bacterium]